MLIRIMGTALIVGVILAAFSDNPTAMAFWDIAKALLIDMKNAFWQAGGDTFNLLKSVLSGQGGQ